MNTLTHQEAYLVSKNSIKKLNPMTWELYLAI